MLPGWLDLSTLQFLMWTSIVVCLIVGAMIVKSLDKPMLRVVTIVLIGILCLSCYQYQRMLNDCKSKGDQCNFFSSKVPQDGGLINL